MNLDLPAVTGAIAAPLVDALLRAEILERKARKLRRRAQRRFETKFDLANTTASRIIAAFKPPA